MTSSSNVARAHSLAGIALGLSVFCLPLLFGAAPYDRVVILGFDGADASLVERYLAEGRLPNLAKLRADGFYAPLRPTK